MATDETELEGLHVLVVEDDADEREMLELLLVHRGARVTAVSTVAEALAICRTAEATARPHVLVSDISMPDQDGYDLIQELRSWTDVDGGRIPAIALTGWCRESDKALAIDAGFQVHLGKPVELQTLVAVIASLARSSAFRELDRAESASTNGMDPARRAEGPGDPGHSGAQSRICSMRTLAANSADSVRHAVDGDTLRSKAD